MKTILVLATLSLPFAILSCRSFNSGDTALKDTPSATSQNSCSTIASGVNPKLILTCSEFSDEIKYVRDSLSNVIGRSPKVSDVIKDLDELSLEGIATPEGKARISQSLQAITPKIDELSGIIRSPTGLGDPNIMAAQGGIRRMLAFLDAEDGFFVVAELTNSTDSKLRGDMARTVNAICSSQGQNFVVNELIKSGCRRSQGENWTCRGVFNCRRSVF